MNTVWITLLAIAGYLLAYHTYGKFLAGKLFGLNNRNEMPSHTFRDGIDFIPTKKHIIFGHHFTTIAGLGPIVGPAIGIIWGWLPALLWIFFGSIFMGAVHDFSSLVVSARNQGKTLGELTGRIISPSTRYAFQFIMQLLLLIVISVFAMIVGILFDMYPAAVFPVWMQIPIAIWLGWKIRQGKNDLVWSVVAVFLMYGTIIAGVYLPVRIFPVAGSSTTTWVIILLVYVYFASTIPVDKLLQPRDYINSHQLMIAMFLLLLGIFVAHPDITAPAINPAAYAAGTDIPGLMPLMFITIACGAISGFHSLAASGTTVKQVDKEEDTLFIGYGGMLFESLLAFLVLMSVAGGLGLGLEKDGKILSGLAAYQTHYASWITASGLNAKLEAFVVGAANLMHSYGIPLEVGKAIIAVFIVSFAGTTLDTATRIQRLSLQEIFTIRDNTVRKPIDNRYVATAVVVIAAGLLAFSQPAGKGALILWPLFGSLNQLLAALALAVVTVWLIHKKKNYLITGIPMLFVLIFTLWSMVVNLNHFIGNKDILLASISTIILILTAWLLIASLYSLIKHSGYRPDNIVLN
ncbi:MAG: carbon starvation protein A [Chlorobi bacterium]|nr:carbon starvation protein A [Chlorobiota bacterium]